MRSSSPEGHEVGPAVLETFGLYITPCRKLEFLETDSSPQQQLQQSNTSRVWPSAQIATFTIAE